MESCRADGYKWAGVTYAWYCCCSDLVINSEIKQHVCLFSPKTSLLYSFMTQEPDQDLLFCSDCECDYPCGGDSSESCGGYYRYNLYQVEREGEQKNKK